MSDELEAAVASLPQNHTVLAPEQCLKARFYQFRPSTADFFLARTGRTDIRIEDTPHYAFARALAGGDLAEIGAGEAFYADYLRASWKPDRHDRIDIKIGLFKQHFDEFTKGRSTKLPVISVLADGEPYVIDGNHRTSFAAALGQDLTVNMTPYELAFKAFHNIPAFYGTGSKSIPYQSILHNGQIVARGRRVDAAQRIGLIPPDILKGSRVLDVASNFGMSSILAKRAGAETVLGLELSGDLTNFATKFAMIEGVYPSVSFRRFNIDTDGLDAGSSFDVAFMFSIYSHLKDPMQLNQIVRDHVQKWVVVEAHPGHKLKKYASLFDAGLFSSVEEVGVLDASATDHTANRTLWVCKVA